MEGSIKTIDMVGTPGRSRAGCYSSKELQKEYTPKQHKLQEFFIHQHKAVQHE